MLSSGMITCYHLRVVLSYQKGGGCYHLWRGLLSSEESVVLSSGMGLLSSGIGLLSSGEGGSYHLGIEFYHKAIFYSVYILMY